jgi:PAS domain S-box-containing protein
MEDATKADAVSRNRNESQQKPPSEVKRKYQPKGIEKFSPNELMLLFILVFLCSEGSGILLESYLESLGKPGGLLIHLVEIFLFLMATFLIVYLPLKRRLADKEKTVEAMRESEQHLRLALEGTNSGLWDWDLSTSMAYYSPSGEKLLGYEPGELEQSIKTWEKLLNPEDREQVMKRLQDHLEGRTSTYEGEYRVRSKSGEWVWFHTLGRVTSRDEQGRPLRMLGMFNNVTDRKNTEAEVHQLLQHIDRAGEDERARVAQDLHDQLGQMVTGLQLGLGVFKREQVEQCQKLIDLTTQLGNEIRSVSSRLRPPALDTGLVPALEYDLERLRRHLQGLRISLNAPGLELERLDPEAEITLFRIYQEALNNAVKHAEARTIDIRLQREGSEIILAVKDDGKGFDVHKVSAARKGQEGIGLLGMKERVASLGGRLEILSKPMLGTTIMAILPFNPQEPKVMS